MLELATEGCCKGHKCDNCATCRKGRCCRRDNPDYKLPEVGEWDGPIYGELGVLNDDGDKVECHCCGAWFRGLPKHIWVKHNLTAREYKALFGLNLTQGLVSATSSAKRAAYREHLERIRPKHVALSMLTSEQLSAVTSRPRSKQASRSYSERAIRTSLQTHSASARAKIGAASRAKWSDAVFKAKMKERLRGREVSPETRAKISEHRKAYWARHRGHTATPETRAKQSAAGKQRWAQKKARLNFPDEA